MARNILRFAIGLATLAVLAWARPSASLAQIPSASAAANDTVRIGLDEAIARALQDNPGLQAVAQQARAAERAAAASFRQHFGELDALGWTSRYNEAQLLRPMSQELLAGGLANMPFAQDQLHYGLTFELPLFVGGTLLFASHVARLKADEAAALLQGTRWQVRANVTTTYAATQALIAATRAYQDEVAALEQTHARVGLMVREGKRPEVDLLEVTDALEEARAQLADANAQRTRVRALLLALLDYPADQALAFDPLPDRFPSLPPDSVDWNALVQRASPVASAELRVRQAAGGKHVALAGFLPKLSLKGNLLENAGSGVPGTQQTWELTLQASVPVLTGGRNVAEYQSAAATERAAQLAERQTLLQQQAEVRGAVARFRAAQDALDAAGKRVAAADEAARIEGVRYDNGAGTIEDLLRAKTRASAAEAFLAQSKGNVLGAAAQLNALVEQEIVR
jgi:outer membrane protein TolC